MTERPADSQSFSAFSGGTAGTAPAGAARKARNRPEEWPTLKTKTIEELHAFFERQCCAPHEFEGTQTQQSAAALERALTWANDNDSERAARIRREIERKKKTPSPRTLCNWYARALDTYRF